MIYLDHNATTPIAPEVLAAMRPYLERDDGPLTPKPRECGAFGAVGDGAVTVIVGG